MKLMKCGHPQDWTIKLKGYGKTYTYCIMCLMNKVGLRHVESYENPAMINPIKKETDKTVVKYPEVTKVNNKESE